VKADYVYICSEGGTQAGLVLGTKLLGEESEVVGIAPTRRDPRRAADIAQWAREGALLLGLDLDISETDIVNRADFADSGREAWSSVRLDAIEMAATAEGLVLDPVYTGTAMAGLIDDVRSGAIKPQETVVFVHTGGTPIIFDHVEEIGRHPARTERA
jgi:1-aminocyclopropane-1-carboxylate deaminase/D-cysteine desulfhydrase-like pyridoxal-dependent ACC family enzyme